MAPLNEMAVALVFQSRGQNVGECRLDREVECSEISESVGGE